MRLGVSGLMLVCAGGLLTLLGLGQLDAALSAPAGSVSGRVSHASSGMDERDARFIVEIAGRPERFQLMSLSLPHPSIDALKAAREVRIDHDTRGRIVGLSVDGRVYFTAGDYAWLIALSALVPLLPGATMSGFGLSMLWRRKAIQPRVTRRRARRVIMPEPAMAVVLPFRPRKTVDGEWLH